MRAPNVVKYQSREVLNERMPNFSVKMGYGLHVGWAIEGAIGAWEVERVLGFACPLLALLLTCLLRKQG